ncbi:MAG: ATP synthase subunit I [Deltaproteobacteria bacterium]|nr:ATP synthase subunit I [Deltaproteobacteria bacterium]
MIAKRSLQLLAFLILLSLFFASWAVSLGIILGGAVAILNFRWLWLIMEKVLLEKKGIHGLQALVKFTALLAAVYAIFRYIGVAPIAFIVGVSTLFLSIVWETIRESLRFARKGNS